MTKKTAPDPIINGIVKDVSAAFRTFGGGRDSEYNPIAHALKDHEPTFAAGVDVRQVVEFVIGAYALGRLKKKA